MVDYPENKTLEKNEFKEEILKEVSKMPIQIPENRKGIQPIVTLKSAKKSTKIKDLIELSIEIWRLENKLKRILPTIPEPQKESINNSMQKIKRYLDKNYIEILDYTNQKFNYGRNLDILAVEKDNNIQEPIIKETKEPTIMHKGKVVRKGKVIILINENQPNPEATK